MAESILKYDLPNSGPHELSVPRPARPLSVGFQRGVLRVWLAGDLTGNSFQKMTFHVVLTGAPAPQPPAAWKCLGRAELDDGAFIVHVFCEAGHG